MAENEQDATAGAQHTARTEKPRGQRSTKAVRASAAVVNDERLGVFQAGGKQQLQGKNGFHIRRIVAAPLETWVNTGVWRAPDLQRGSWLPVIATRLRHGERSTPIAP